MACVGVAAVGSLEIVAELVGVAAVCVFGASGVRFPRCGTRSAYRRAAAAARRQA
jgi:hypothetical protein